MGCNAPLVGWLGKERTARGKRVVRFDLSEGLADRPVYVPCGRCFGCQLDRSRQWAVRCSHEAQLWKANSFVTLTYRDEELPRLRGCPTLRPEDFTKFMKRLRKARSGDVVRYLQAGEYGELGRPHHHAVLFNVGFGDGRPWQRSGEAVLYRSEELERLWPFGFSSVGEVTFASAGYVAQYTLKKAFDRQAQVKGDGVRYEVDQLGRARVAPYMTMSRRPGIGRDWFEKFSGDVYPADRVVTDTGAEVAAPRFYRELLEKSSPAVAAAVTSERFRRALNVPYVKWLDGERHGAARDVIARRRARDRRPKV